jgi:hypothetical protein
MVKVWICIPPANTHEWTDDLTLAAWWMKMLKDAMANRKAMATITMLVTWTIWKEQNASSTTSPAPCNLLDIIKVEAKLWVVGGVKGV